MKLINQSVQLVTEENPLKCIELAGRVSHKSEDRITEDSHKVFIKQMLKLGHTATLEFGSVYLQCPNLTIITRYYDYDISNFVESPYIHIEYSKSDVRIYSNLRVILNKFPELFVDIIHKSLPEKVELFTPSNDDPYKRYTFKIICNRGVSHELVRHRVFSFLQESTRYCNYSKDKFSNELNIINPFNNFINTNPDIQAYYKIALSVFEKDYNYLTSRTEALKAQEARGILPNDLKTELYMCGFLKDWVGHNVETYAIDIFGESIDVTTRLGFDTLRRHASAHPQAREIAELIFEELIKEVGSTEFIKIKETYYE